jgi:hypothetical protein
MHELTLHELDAELAEQLPARELMQVARVHVVSVLNQGAVAAAGGGLVSIGNTAVALNLATVTQIVPTIQLF